MLLLLSMIKSVEVYKSVEVCIDEGGIGGIVILYICKLFEMEVNLGVLSVEVIYDDVFEDIKL